MSPLMNEAGMIEAMARAIDPRAWQEHDAHIVGDPEWCKDRVALSIHGATAALAAVQPEIDRLRADNARLRSALEPFAEAATKGEIGGYPPAYFCGAGDDEKARAALSAPALDGEGR